MLLQVCVPADSLIREVKEVFHLRMDEMEAAIGTDGLAQAAEPVERSPQTDPTLRAHICHSAHVSATGTSQLSGSRG